MQLVGGDSARHLPPFLCKAGYELTMRAETSHFFSMPWTSAVSSLSLPGCTLDLRLKIPDPSVLVPPGADAVICLCTLYSHYNTGCFAAIASYANPRKKSLSLSAMCPLVPWTAPGPGPAWQQWSPICSSLLHAQRAARDVGCCSAKQLSQQLGDSRALLCTAEAWKDPRQVWQHLWSPQNAAIHDGLCFSLLCAPLGFIYAFLNHTVSTQQLNRIKK